MINLIRAEDTGVWTLPDSYEWNQIVTVYLDGKEIFEDIDFMKVNDRDIDVFRTAQNSMVTALIRK